MSCHIGHGHITKILYTKTSSKIVLLQSYSIYLCLINVNYLLYIRSLFFILFGEAFASSKVGTDELIGTNGTKRSIRISESLQLPTTWCLLSRQKSTYIKAYDDMTTFIHESRKLSRPHEWLKWLDNRRTHIVEACRPLYNAPNDNLAEASHASMEHCGGCNLSLVDAV